MSYRTALLLAFLGAALTGCAGARGGALPVPPATSPLTAPPAPPAAAAPARPAFLRSVPARPPQPNVRGASAATHPSFFDGATALDNGVSYLALPNGTPFGYYAYLTDPAYIYHFDMGYEYVVDANDGQNGIYLYDFAGERWWYTSTVYPFPYLYDFTANSVLYYYPAADVQHYSSAPRVFYDFAAQATITIPSATLAPQSLAFSDVGAAAAKTFTASEPDYAGAFRVDAGACTTPGIAAVRSAPQSGTFTVTPLQAGSCTLIVTDDAGGRAAERVVVTTTIVVGQ